MEQNKYHSLSPTQEDISHINPYQQSAQPVSWQSTHHPSQPGDAPVHQPVHPPVQPTAVQSTPSTENGFAQSFPTTPDNIPPNIDPTAQSAKKMGRVSFILGLISLVCMLAAIIISELKVSELYGLAYLLLIGVLIGTLALSITGIVLGVKSHNRLKTGNPLAKAGLILSIITIIINVVTQVIISLSVINGFAWFLN